MSRESAGILLAVIGGIALAVAGVKFFVIGFYPEELVPFAVIGVVGAALCWTGSKLYQAAKQAG
ncbi:hypothetical protein [Aeromicrobium fastidiosum]|uniref:Uncharacterized protein n=1 Tax=Aeromicrobium fastidiosum TaxID=52699 RepID=A0A641AS38_9ACTN|nr:hypothetical protein [Aeromicrobium fastidiosum]KAA1380492.1 hypothetical protein ESP62_004755 [Aeromicrobium fastidiosum]MBP2390082.1 membrane protein implicated in regulation of membrane protease activity [Aeromicrobium fastidiosum]